MGDFWHGRHGRFMALPAALAAAAVLWIQSAAAAVPEDQAARLGGDLTPVGAERAGNADGSIPDWTGGFVGAPPCFAGYGSRYCDPFPEDQARFTITAENLAAHTGRLTDGQIALLRRFPDSYRMPVYTTRRSFANPDFVYEASRLNAVQADLQANGEALVGASVGVPFPIPENAAEVIWNHKTRYRDISVRRWNNQFAVPASGDYNQTKIREDVLFAYARPGFAALADKEKVLTYFLQVISQPPRLDGTLILVHETMDQIAGSRRAWQYSPGQQRIRSAPGVGYDTPGPGTDGLRTYDQIDMFTGPMDRYEWKLLDKRELYVPANSYRLHSDALRYSDIVGKGHLNPDHVRYELRRVWVVEANLRPGVAHTYKRRRFYLDEDGWQIRAVDVYDARGELRQLQEAHTVIAYDKPYELPVCETVYDLQENRYLAQTLNNEDPETVTQVFETDHFESRKVSKLVKK